MWLLIITTKRMDGDLALPQVVVFCLRILFWCVYVLVLVAKTRMLMPMPVFSFISSELLSMPAVKRFSVSFAKHPTNGTFAYLI